MQELLPIGIGVVLGLFLEARRAPGWLPATLVVLLAVCACVASGEFRVSWGYLLADMVEAAAAVGFGWCVIRCSRRLRTPLGS